MRATRSSPQRRAADLDARDRAVMEEIHKEQKARYEQSARLRALRLAKEADDRERAEKEEAERRFAAERASKTSAKKPPRRRQKPAADKEASKEQPEPRG